MARALDSLIKLLEDQIDGLSRQLKMTLIWAYVLVTAGVTLCAGLFVYTLTHDDLEKMLSFGPSDLARRGTTAPRGVG